MSHIKTSLIHMQAYCFSARVNTRARQGFQRICLRAMCARVLSRARLLVHSQTRARIL